MSFTNVGSVEGIFTVVTSSSDTVSAAIPDLAAQSIGIVLIGKHGTGNTVTGVTWNGVAMTVAVPSTINAASEVALFYLANPADNGTYNIVVSYTISTSHNSHITVAWADAGAAVSLDDTSTATGTAQNPTITNTQVGTNELVTSVAHSQANNLGVPVVSGCTELQSHDFGGNCSSSAYSIPVGSGDATHTHNFGASDTYAICSASFKEAAAPGGGNPWYIYAQ